MVEKSENNKKYNKLCEIIKNSDITMDEALKCIKKKHGFEETKDNKKD